MFLAVGAVGTPKIAHAQFGDIAGAIIGHAINGALNGGRFPGPGGSGHTSRGRE